MVKILPINMASNDERAGLKPKPLKLIRHGVLVTPLLIGNAYADGEQAYSFNLPAQPLSATLDSLAQSAHTKLIYADATVKGLRAAPVKGKYTTQQALNIALGQSGLNYKVVDKTLITVSGKPAAASPASTVTLKPMTVVGEAVQDPNDPYASGNKFPFQVETSTAGSKIPLEITQVQQSIQVITSKAFEDQGALSIGNIMEQVPSASVF